MGLPLNGEESICPGSPELKSSQTIGEGDQSGKVYTNEGKNIGQLLDMDRVLSLD